VPGDAVLAAAAYDAIASTLPKGPARWPIQRDRGQSFIQVEAAVVDRSATRFAFVSARRRAARNGSSRWRGPLRRFGYTLHVLQRRQGTQFAVLRVDYASALAQVRP
jgi:hypothetical protein